MIHAPGHAIAPLSLPKCPTALLAALVGVKQHTLIDKPAADRASPEL